MPLIFKSKAAGDVLMVSAHAQALLNVLGKSVPGILQPADMPLALSILRALPDEPPPDEAADEDERGAPATDGVSPRKRAWPLIRMIEESLAADEPIVWGV